MNAWYTATPTGPGITLIREPHAHPLVQANTWHIKGSERDLLIDAGLGVTSLRSALPRLAGDREPVVVLTHAHLDHMGGAHEFTEVWAHPDEPTGLPGRGSLVTAELAGMLGLDLTGVPGLPEFLITARPHADYDPSGYELRPVTVTRELHDGDEIDLGDRTLRVLHLPGHTAGSIALLDEAAGALFSGDVVYDDVLLDDVAGADIAGYVASMRRLRLLDVRVVYPGHAEVFDRARLHELIDEYLARRAG